MSILVILAIAVSVSIATDDRQHMLSSILGRRSADPFQLNREAGNLKALDADGLAKQLKDDLVESRPTFRKTEIQINAVCQLWAQTGDSDLAATATRVLRATVAPYIGKSPEELAAMVTTRGRLDPSNADMRDACRHLALLRVITNDHNAGAAAVAILTRLSQVIPSWPLWLPYSETVDKRISYPQDSPLPYKDWQCAGLWGNWIYFDLVDAVPLAEAWRILRGCGDLPAGDADIAIRRMLDLHIEIQHRFSAEPMYSNMDNFQIQGLMELGVLLESPSLVHAGVRQLVNLYRTSFYADGWWHEGSASYHDNLQRGLSDLIDTMLPRYSDPVGWFDEVEPRRFDGLSLHDLVKVPSRQADRVLQDITLPDGNYRAVHDTVWPQQSKFTPRRPSGSRLFGCYGEGTLVSWPGPSETSVNLHFSGTGGHAHFDALNLQVWSKGVEAISETQYYPPSGFGTTREWHTMTAGHATVVVNEVDQGATVSRVRKPQSLDAIEGIPDWASRWSRCANVDQGTLRLFNTKFNEVQVIEADAEASYDSVVPVDLYRRTVSLVQIDRNDDYIVDIFRVRGGRVHDFMLHSCLQEPTEVHTNLSLEDMPGTLHRYIGALQSAQLDDGGRVEFHIGGKAILHTYICPIPGAKVVIGEAPAMRRPGMAPFVNIRNASGESSFVMVHHVVSGSGSRIHAVTPLPCDEVGAVAIEIDLGFRKDIVISRRDRAIGVVKAGGVETTAMFAHVAQLNTGAGQWAFMADGDLLAAPWCSVQGSVSYEGAVLSATRIAAGDRFDGLTVSPAIPSNCSVKGETIILHPADLAAWAYPIIEHASKEDTSFIALQSDPGLAVSASAVKQECYPGFGAKGPTTFRIPGSAALFRDQDGAWTLQQSGQARASTTDGTKVHSR